MAMTIQQTANGNGSARTSLTDVLEIQVRYDDANDAVTVSPGEVNKGTTARFVNPEGGLRIVFLSPSGEEMKSVSDSELCTLAIGGIYHFRCYFRLTGKSGEISPTNGGVIDILPHRP
ncbi:MAG TPA: hypothetical protein VG759_17385 [Candidatus Angelobacter sp.]|jgi:hypothetical protein|nr:hypothetical protein [Candidatus Angelobacter sp.]